MPLYEVTLRERSAPHRTLPCGLHRGATAEAAIKTARNKLKGMNRRLEMGDAAWLWTASVKRQ